MPEFVFLKSEIIVSGREWSPSRNYQSDGAVWFARQWEGPFQSRLTAPLDLLELLGLLIVKSKEHPRFTCAGCFPPSQVAIGGVWYRLLKSGFMLQEPQFPYHVQLQLQMWFWLEFISSEDGDWRASKTY